MNSYPTSVYYTLISKAFWKLICSYFRISNLAHFDLNKILKMKPIIFSASYLCNFLDQTLFSLQLSLINPVKLNWKLKRLCTIHVDVFYKFKFEYSHPFYNHWETITPSRSQQILYATVLAKNWGNVIKCWARSKLLLSYLSPARARWLRYVSAL